MGRHTDQRRVGAQAEMEGPVHGLGHRPGA